MKKLSKTPSQSAPRKLALRGEAIATLASSRLAEVIGGGAPRAEDSVLHNCTTTSPGG
jgi:hypothetical protein